MNRIVLGWRFDQLSFRADRSSSTPDESKHLLRYIQAYAHSIVPAVERQISPQSYQDSNPAGTPISDFNVFEDALFPSLSLPNAGQDGLSVLDFSSKMGPSDTFYSDALWIPDLLSDAFTGFPHDTGSGTLQTGDLATHLYAHITSHDVLSPDFFFLL